MTPTVTIAVTGLSGSGKTVFLTSIIHRLLHWKRKEMKQFPKRPLAYPVKAEILSAPETGWLGRLPFGGRLKPKRLRRFPYEENLNSLKQSPPHWPESTTEPSEFRLRVSYRRTKSHDKKQCPHGKWHDVNVILIDYPGEWLLDLPLLEKDFRLWSAEEIARAKEPLRAPYSCKWLSLLERADSSAPCSPSTAAALVAEYRAYIDACARADQGIVHLQPGFFLNCPQEHRGKPYMEFCPLNCEDVRGGRRGKATLCGEFTARYRQFRSEVVRPFRDQTFLRADVQIVLLDVLNILRQGSGSYGEHRRSLHGILGSFKYGGRSPFHRRISRSIFAASKADHATNKQHKNMESLVADIASEASEKIVTGRKADATIPKPTYVSAHCSTRSVDHVEEGVTRTRLRGTVIGREEEGEVDWLTPDIPNTFPSDDWETSRYRYYRFQPAPFPRKEGMSPPHINLDAVLGLALQGWVK